MTERKLFTGYGRMSDEEMVAAARADLQTARAEVAKTMIRHPRFRWAFRPFRAVYIAIERFVDWFERSQL